MNLEGLKKFTSEVDGWLTEKEGAALYNLAKQCGGQNAIVEIGSWKGKSAIWLGWGSKNGNRRPVYAIDPHTGSPEHYLWYGQNIQTFNDFKNNIDKAGLQDTIIPIVKTSAEAVKNFDKAVELIFIDGNHEYKFVELDFNLWFPKLVNGGIIVFHDTTGWAPWRGPFLVAAKYVYNSPYFKNIKIVDSMTIAQKTGKNSLKDRIRNLWMLLAAAWFAGWEIIRRSFPVTFF